MEGIIGEIRMFGGNFAPRGWALCTGQLLAIDQNQALFSIIGTTYGGDGRTTFALPDLRSRVAIGQGNGPGLSDYRLGMRGGVETVRLTIHDMPSHNHAAQLTNGMATVTTNLVKGSGKGTSGDYISSDSKFKPNPTTDEIAGLNSVLTDLQGSVTVGNNGGSQAHTNMQPWQCVNFIICLQGVFPSRS